MINDGRVQIYVYVYIHHQTAVRAHSHLARDIQTKHDRDLPLAQQNPPLIIECAN